MILSETTRWIVPKETNPVLKSSVSVHTHTDTNTYSNPHFYTYRNNT